jgi:purine-nucleoside phosphorylase
MPQRLDRLSDRWRERVAAACAWLADRGFTGRVGLILGSGLGELVDGADAAEAVEYAAIPGFVSPTVHAHRGRLVRATLAGVPVLGLQGRLHAYEGHSWPDLLMPAAVLAGGGVKSALVTNAAGGLNPHFRSGDLMVIRDQVDLHLGDPLRGLLAPPSPREAARPVRGAAFYDGKLAEGLRAAANSAGVPVHVGTYASVWGPAYETPAEIGMLRRIGCDATGMSTAAEVALLAALEVRTAGLSCITNVVRDIGQPELSHADVVAVGRQARARLERVLLAFLPAAATRSSL